ncbi:MAG: lipoate--protein ligase [Bacteroidales bacterium]|nr:lipoate--protein ligase [Bacteroidales bacterium]
MICLYNDNTNPQFNLAAEEYLLLKKEEDIFMLWRNEPSIIIGKFQNAIAEINLDYVQEKNIKVVRRITGGGAVFHDLGNLNFTFIKNGTKGDFRGFSEPILQAMRALGINAEFEGRNDLSIDGQKISGNAECIKNGRVLHHGTLLFSAEMNDLVAALKVNPLKFKDKAVKSVRKRVTNISSHLTQSMSVIEFTEHIMNYILSHQQDTQIYHFTEEDLLNIKELQKKKYETWQWNFGDSPNYALTRQGRTKGGNIEINMNFEKGIITAVKIYGDFFCESDLSEFEEKLVGHPHDREHLKKLINTLGIEKYILNTTTDELIELMF